MLPVPRAKQAQRALATRTSEKAPAKLVRHKRKHNMLVGRQKCTEFLPKAHHPTYWAYMPEGQSIHPICPYRRKRIAIFITHKWQHVLHITTIKIFQPGIHTDFLVILEWFVEPSTKNQAYNVTSDSRQQNFGKLGIILSQERASFLANLEQTASLMTFGKRTRRAFRLLRRGDAPRTSTTSSSQMSTFLLNGWGVLPTNTLSLWF